MRFKEADGQKRNLIYLYNTGDVHFQVGDELAVYCAILRLETKYLQRNLFELALIADGKYLLFIRLCHCCKDKVNVQMCIEQVPGFKGLALTGHLDKKNLKP